MNVTESTVREINLGSEKSFAILYDSYFTYLCSYASTYIYDHDEAKDVVNEMFINLWLHRESLRFPIHGYMVRSIKNACLNYIRALQIRERNTVECYEDLLLFREDLCINDEDPLTLLEVEELKNKVNDIIDTFPAKCREIFELFFYAGKSPQEIAENLNLSVNTIRVQIKNATDRLRKELGYLNFIFFLFFISK